MDIEKLLAKNITDISELSDLLKLSKGDEEKLKEITETFPILITPYYLNLIDWEDPNDPLKRLCVPILDGFDTSGSLDTSGEESNTKLKGLQHKYGQTALILSTNKCALYCRFCFRKRIVGQNEQDEATSKIDDINAQYEYIKAHPEINNILISGGDSLINSNDTIRYYLKKFSSLNQLDFIRFGTRVPVVLPMRIYNDDELLSMFEEYNKKKQIVIVTHFNHPREITEEATKAINALKKRGLILRNQTVLLKGINDNVETLSQLIQKLTRVGIIPYYIFQCRPVAGVKSQFQVPILKGCVIIDEVRALQNGQGKSFRYAMSHPLGKIEIIGKLDDERVLFKFHQSKYPENVNKIFSIKLEKNQAWLDDNPI